MELLHFMSLKKYFFNCDYKINDDGTLQNKNCINEPIISAKECDKNPDFCYIGSGNYKTTKVPLRFYKKTRIYNTRFDVSTEIIVPSGSDIYVDAENQRTRVSVGIVGKQYLLDGDYENKMYIKKSYSLYDRYFKYESGNIIQPDKFWNQYDDRRHGYKEDMSYCRNGIHVFNDEIKAREY
jgi:hypothetical protein